MADDKSSKEVSLNLDDPKYSKGLSVDEWQKLSKQNPTTLTPSQQKTLTQANDSIREATKGISTQLASMVKGVWVFPHLLTNAQVGKIDYSKNIVFDDHTPVSTIVHTSMQLNPLTSLQTQ
jgi:hypothetical protein